MINCESSNISFRSHLLRHIPLGHPFILVDFFFYNLKVLEPNSNFTKGNGKTKDPKQLKKKREKKMNNSDCVINEIICSECDAIFHLAGQSAGLVG